MSNQSCEPFLRDIKRKKARRMKLSLSKDKRNNCLFGQSYSTIKVTDEETCDEIQKYAATTMSELLGWYGYEKVDTGCTRSLNLDHFTAVSNIRSRLSQTERTFAFDDRPRSANALNSPIIKLSGLPLRHSADNLNNSCRSSVSPPLRSKTSTLTFSDNFTSCAWCGRISQLYESEKCNCLSYNATDYLGQSCDQACFTGEDASIFKQDKTCNCCTHARNPVSYVDLQGGESRLQFCNDKCLNQYKMNIFCHETQTYLTHHGLNDIPFQDSEKSSLITPELWFQNCESPGHSSPEDVLIFHDHSSSDLSLSNHENQTKRKGDNEYEKSAGSNESMTRKKSKLSVKKCVKHDSCNDKKICYTGGNKNKVSKLDVQESLNDGETQKFHRYTSDPIYCRINCSEASILSCIPAEASKSHEKKYNPSATMDHYSPSHRENSDATPANNINRKDMETLQDKQNYSQLENVLKASFWFPNSIAKPSPFVTMSPLQSEQTEPSSRSPSTPLQPYMLFLPYPVPIPVPIPIPIPAPIFAKLMAGKQETTVGSANSTYKQPKRENPSESRQSSYDESKLSTIEKISTTKDSSPVSSSTNCYTALSSVSSCTSTDDLDALKNNSKPLRKRKHFNEPVNSESQNVQSKRRKFVTA